MGGIMKIIYIYTILLGTYINGMEMQEIHKPHHKHHHERESFVINLETPQEKLPKNKYCGLSDNQVKIAAISGIAIVISSGITAGISLALHYHYCN